MMGCLVWWKCLLACLFFDESQQPTWPQIRHSRKCTQVPPISRHSLQPLPLGVTWRISFTCGLPSSTCAIIYLVEYTVLKVSFPALPETSRLQAPPCNPCPRP